MITQDDWRGVTRVCGEDRVRRMVVGEEYPRDAVEEGEQRGSEVYGGTSSPCNELPITRYMYIYICLDTK
jgi:hypothetical protein